MITQTPVQFQPTYVTALLANATPYCVGIVDAQKGIAARPDLYDHDGDRSEYAQGYADEAASIARVGRDGELTTPIELDDADFDVIFGRVAAGDTATFTLDLFDYEGEADDLVEARYDEEFWAHGC